MDTQTQTKLRKEFYHLSDRYVKKGAKKLTGIIAVEVIKRYIENVLWENEQYKGYSVSPNNSYIDGYKTEWDLLVLKPGTKQLDGLNIYSAQSVAVVIECKAHGIFNRKMDSHSLKGPVDAYKELRGSEPQIKFAYITISEQIPAKRGINFIEETKQYFDNNDLVSGETAFFVGLSGKRNRDTAYTENQCSWEEFILGLLA